MITPNGMEFVILTCCCAPLPTFTEPKFIEVGLAVTEEAAALPAVIRANSWIIVTRDAKQICFDMVRFVRTEGTAVQIKFTGPFGFLTTEGVYELAASSVYWPGGTSEDRVRRCPLMYRP